MCVRTRAVYVHCRDGQAPFRSTPRGGLGLAQAQGGVYVNFRAVLLAYVDESGNTGPVNGGGSLTYTLGCVLVEAEQWPTAFEELLQLRRRLRTKFGLPMRAEVKANALLRGTGPFKKLALAPAERRLIYRAHLTILASLPARAFAVVVDKRGWNPKDYFDLAWEGLLQRLERTSSHEQTTFMVLHDEGENAAVRAWVRRSRRHLTAGSAFGGPAVLRNPARMLVDDPVPRKSHHSYMVQLADLVAYAAFRSVIAPGANVAQVCPSPMWLAVGSATHVAVSSVRPRAAPGIVLR
jgi:hypothetical protein